MNPSKFTEFDRNGETVTAIPESADDDEVDFDATIADRSEQDEAEGNWEELIGRMIDYDDGQAVSFDGGSASLPGEDAVDVVVESDDELATTRLQAEAVLEYLNHEGIVDITDSGPVTVLKSFESIEETRNFQMCNNWAVAFDTFVERIDNTTEKIERVKESLDTRETEIQPEDNVDNKQEKSRHVQKMRNLLDGRAPVELGEEESKQFRYHRNQYEFYDSVSDTQLDEDTRQQELAMSIERFDDVKSQMKDRRDEFRKIAMTEAVFPDDPDQIADVLVSMESALSPEERMESTSDDEFAEELFANEETVEQLDESTEELSESTSLTGENVEKQNDLEEPAESDADSKNNENSE